ncbi:hypothetical protein [Muribaculum intestinale]
MLFNNGFTRSFQITCDKRQDCEEYAEATSYQFVSEAKELRRYEYEI